MSSTLQPYAALPSETASATPSLCPPQLSCEKADSSTAPSNSGLSRQTCIPRFWKNWEWEFAACVLALATPIIIFATLYPHSGQPLPQWPFKVSINSLLSIYALVLKAVIGFILTSCIGQLQWTWFSETRPLTDMLYFDNATRGADGALGLIWRQRLRQPLTALGCTIMVLAVTVDPFVQQLVRPVDCSIEVSDGSTAATMPRANVFFGDADYNRNLMGKDVENIFYEAISSPGQGPPWQCSTGNCTFPGTYGTIGICSSCEDASSDVIFKVTCSDPYYSYAGHQLPSIPDCGNSSKITLESHVTSNFTLESHLTTSKDMNLWTEMNIDISNSTYRTMFMTADAYAEFESGNPMIGPDWSNLNFGFLMGATPTSDRRTDWTPIDNSTCNAKAVENSWSCQGYGAATCSLHPCVQIFNATISAGVLHEHLVESSSDTAWGTVYDESGFSRFFTLLDTQCSAEIQAPSKRDASMGSRWLPYSFNISNSPDYLWDESGNMIEFVIDLPDEATKLLESKCLYMVSMLPMLDAMRIGLSGTIHGEGHSFNYTGNKIGEMGRFRGPEVIRSIFNWGHTDFQRVQGLIANISNSFTTYIRTHGGSPQLAGSTNFSRDVQGRVYHYATCLEVQWPWLSFTACLTILATLFFLMVVGATRRQGASVWKASPLAWVLRAEGPGNGLFSSSDGSCEAMKERSTQIVVHLHEGDSHGPCVRMADLKDPNLL